MYQYVGIAQVIPRGLMQDSLEPCLTFDEFDDLVLFYIPPFLFYFEASLLIFSLNELLTKFLLSGFLPLDMILQLSIARAYASSSYDRNTL